MGWQLPKSVTAEDKSEASAATALVRPDRFDEATFHRLLVRFIIADNQVGSPLTLVTVLMFPHS